MALVALALAGCAAPAQRAPVIAATAGGDTAGATQRGEAVAGRAGKSRAAADVPSPAAPGHAVPADAAATPAWGQRFYLDDGPGDRPLVELDAIPDAVPVEEPPRPSSNRPYAVFGNTYTPLEQASGFSQSGLASWYGKRFHGRRTSSGEPFDMYAMTAAHPTLPIPSYARVTNLANGRSVVVRINDRGPFHPGRIVDLSYAAAHRLGFAARGSAEVTVEAVPPGDGASPGAALAGIEPIPTRSSPGEAPRFERIGGSPRNLPPGAGKGLWLQLGAFGSRENAEALRRKVADRLVDLAPGLQVAETGGRWRVRIGPLHDREAMDYARAALKQQLGISAVSVNP